MERNTPFSKALETFRDGLTKKQQAEFSTITSQDVELEVERIQRQYGPTKKLRHMRRISKFLEAMKQLEQVISVFLNVSSAVAFIWVSLRLLPLSTCTPITFKHTRITDC